MSAGSYIVRELQVGEIVYAHGMRLEIVDPPQRSQSHPDDHGGCFYTRAVVTNRDEVPPHAVPLGFTPADDEGRPRWSLQGNDLARVFGRRDA